MGAPYSRSDVACSPTFSLALIRVFLNSHVVSAGLRVHPLLLRILSKTSSSSGKEQIDVKKAKFSATCIA